MHVAKLVYNSNGWSFPTGLASDGIIVNDCEVFGFEEWINNPVLRGLKIGFIESFRTCRRPKTIDRIALITFCKRTKTVYFVGNLYTITQIDNNQIPQIRQLLPSNWLEIIAGDFNRQFPNTNAFQQYLQCYNSNIISGSIGGSFVFNIKYEKLELFPRKNWINLTSINPDVNNKWKHLKQLYNVPNEFESLF